MIRSAVLILSGNLAQSALLLIRNLLIARLIPVEDYGIAATIAVVVAIMEMTSNLGLQLQIVQSKRGDDPAFQAALQGFQLLRGVLASLLIVIFAQPIADFMNLSDVAWAYRLVALVPVLTALQHFDIHRLNRDMVFMPIVLSYTVPALLSLLAVWPLAMALGDFRVLIYAMLLQGGITTVMSHLTARRRWQLSLDRGVIAESLRFGWPLLVNNVLLFAVLNGERIIVGRELGMVDLAIFSMGVTLIMTPTLIIEKSFNTFFMPQLSRRRASGQDAGVLSLMVVQAALITALAFALGVMLVGAPVVYLLLGDKYLPLLPFLTWMAVMQALRVVKVGPNVVAIAHGFTGNAMASNIVRVLSLALSWVVAVRTGDILYVLWIAIGAELAGYAIALWLMKRRVELPMRRLALPFVLAGLCLAWIGVDQFLRPITGPQLPGAAAALGAMGLFIACAASMPDLLTMLRRIRQG